MKKANMDKIKSILGFAFMAVILTFTTACPDKNDRNTSVARRDNRRPDFNPNTNPSNPSQSVPDYVWGGIAHSGYSALDSFMVGADLGNVSTSYNDSTGIRFMRSGQDIYILVWDDRADREGAYLWPMQISNIDCGSGYLIEVEARDAAGSIRLSGNIQNNGDYQGTVTFQNSIDNASGRLGNFVIYADSFFSRNECN